MSDKKPGFFKRLLGNLMGSKEKEPAPPPEEPKTEAKAPAAKKPAEKKPAAKKPAAKKPPAKKPAEKKPAAKTAKKPAAKAAPAPKAEKKPVAVPKAKPEAKPAPKPKAEPKSKAKPAPKPKPAKKPATQKSAPAAEKAPPEKPPEAPIETPAEAPIETPAEDVPEPETKKRRSLSDIIPFRSKKEAAAEPEPAPEAEPVPEPEVISEPEAAQEPVPEPAPEQAVAREAAEEPAEKKGWFSRLRDGLSKTSNALTENITTIFTKRKLDDETLQELEDALIQADLGVDMAVQITEEVARGRYNKEISPEEVRAVLGAEVAGVLEPTAQPLVLDDSKTPHVVLVVGVNGTGKTTTIGKLGHKFNQEGKKTVLAAGDTFRAAAIDQLKIWGERIGAPVVSGKIGADAAGLAYDALQQAQQSQADVLLIDTAGRLQNKADLMEELAKIVRVVKKLDDSAPHSVLLVLDATTGQNAMRQVEVFQEIAGVTGLVMTKLDGTARGGILVAIAKRFELPVHAIGVGETIEDLQPFDAFEFAAAIAGAQEMVEA